MQKVTSMKDFEITQKLGAGSFGQVFKVKRKEDNQIYALKQVKMNMLSEKEKENALNEIRILASFTDPNIVEYKECFFDETSSCLCLVMEFCDGGDVYNLIKKQQGMNKFLDEQQVWIYLIQICKKITQKFKTFNLVKGLSLLHSLNIFHRDMKCANIFISKNICKLGDFNISKFAKNNFAFTQAGTPYYTAPEIWRGERYTMKCDIWSIGCILYEMVTFQPPFKGMDMEGLNRSIQRGVFTPINKQKYSTDLQNIISLCLKTQSGQRPSADELLNNPIILKHMSKEQNSNSQQIVYTKQDLLKTIMLPKNLKELKNKLPKANYEKKQTKSVDKQQENQQQNQQQIVKTNNEKVDQQQQPKQGTRIQSAQNSKSYQKQQQSQQQSEQQAAQQKDYQKYYAQLISKQNPQQQQQQQQQQNQQKLPPQIPKPSANLPPSNKPPISQLVKEYFQPSSKNQIAPENSKKKLLLPDINSTPQYHNKASSSKYSQDPNIQQYRSPQIQSKSPSVRCSSAQRGNSRNQSNNIQQIFNCPTPQSNYTKDYYQFLNQKNVQDSQNQRRNSGHQVLKNL